MGNKLLICINNKNNDFALTINKEYKTLKEDEESYQIRNDTGNYVWYDKENFKTNRLEELKEKIKELQDKAQEAYNKYPYDLIDLGEVQAYKEVIRLIERGIK
jgi:hypothetical protein